MTRPMIIHDSALVEDHDHARGIVVDRATPVVVAGNDQSGIAMDVVFFVNSEVCP